MSTKAQVKLEKGAFISLICDQTSLFSINKPGAYNLSKFSDSCKTPNNSITDNYLRFVWNQLTSTHASAEKNRKEFMNNIGAVSRGVNNIWIDPRLDTLNFAGTDFPLTWKSYAQAESFEFSLYDVPEEGKPILATVTKTKMMPINKLLSKIQPGKIYYWTAAVNDEENDERKVLVYWTPENFNQLLHQLKDNGSAEEGEAEQAFRLGFLLESHRFPGEAYKYYEKAAELKPDMAFYKSTLQAFKKDYDIK